MSYESYDTKMDLRVLFICVCCLGLTPVREAAVMEAAAQLRDTTAAVDTVYRAQTLILPALGSDPESGFMFGGVLMRQFKPRGAGPDTRSSNVLLSAIYTTKRQLLISLLTDILLPGERWVTNGNNYLNYFPQKYWGVGRDAEDQNEVDVLFTQVNLEQNALTRLPRQLFVGPNVRYSRLMRVRFEDSNGWVLPPPRVAGAGGSTAAGAGITARWDERNSMLTPTEKQLIETSLAYYPTWLGSTDGYGALKVDARKYFGIGQRDDRTIIATQILARLTWGDTPFWDLSKLGGDEAMRGYYEGRYRDYNAVQVQSEIRQHVYWRFGITVFATAGEVWGRFDEAVFDAPKWTVGGGLRFNVNKSDPTNIRIDYGIGNGTSGFYLAFGEAY